MGDCPQTTLRRPILTMPIAWIYDSAGRLLGGTPLDSERMPDGGLRASTGMFPQPLNGLTFCFSVREATPNEQ